MALDAGIPINQQCIDIFEDFKIGKKFDFVIFRATDKLSEIVVDSYPCKGDSQKSWDELQSKTTVAREENEPVEYWNMRRLILESGLPRYATVMVPKGSGEKLLLIVWAPDNAGMRQNMVYMAAKATFKGKLTGLQGYAQCNDMEELSFSEVQSGFKRN